MVNPFGNSISSDDIVESLSFFDDWEQRYQYVIDLGKELPDMPDDKKDDEHIVRGCQSQVWIDCTFIDGKLHIMADSDAFIVKGLLGVVLAAYNNKTPSQVQGFDIDAYFEAIGLLKHLSAIRGNGLKAMVKTIRDISAALPGN